MTKEKQEPGNRLAAGMNLGMTGKKPGGGKKMTAWRVAALCALVLLAGATGWAQQSTYVPGNSSAAATSVTMPGGATITGAAGSATIQAQYGVNLDAAGGLRIAGQAQNALPADLQQFSVQHNAVLAPGSSGAFDAGAIDSETWIEAGGRIYLFYCGWNSSQTEAEIGLATGPNFQSLTKQGVVLAPGPAGSWDSGYVCGPRIYHENGTYYLFYNGGQGTSYEAAPSSIGVATSTNLTTWTPASANPILTPGASGAWNDKQLFRPFVFKWQGTYYLFYNAADSAGAEQIGYATASSPTGPWTNYAANPVFSPTGSGWESQHVLDPEIFRFAGTWAMLYSGYSSASGQGIGWAFSSDLNTWTRSALNPLYVQWYPSAYKMEAHRLGDKWVATFEQSAPGIFVAEGQPFPFPSSTYSDGTAPTVQPWWIEGASGTGDLNIWQYNGSGYTGRILFSQNGPVQFGDTSNIMSTIPDVEIYQPSQNANLFVGQDSTHNFVVSWHYNSNPASGYALLETYGNTNPLFFQSLGGSVGIGSTNTPEATLDVTGDMRTAPATFASLPSCGATIQGAMRSITDSTTNTWGATIAGGGSDAVLAFCDGSNWTVAAK